MTKRLKLIGYGFLLALIVASVKATEKLQITEAISSPQNKPITLQTPQPKVEEKEKPQKKRYHIRTKSQNFCPNPEETEKK